MSEPSYALDEGCIRLRQVHLSVIGVVYLAGIEAAREQVGAEEVAELVALGIIDEMGELDTPVALLAATITDPRRELDIRAAEGVQNHQAHGWASFHSLVLVAPVPDAPDLVDVNIEPSVDLPPSLARLVGLGPRPVVAERPPVRLEHELLNRALTSDTEEDVASWPELGATASTKRRSWVVRSYPKPGLDGLQVSVVDLGDGGLWMVERNDDHDGEVVLTPVTATAVWAELTLLLRDLFSE